MTTLSIRRCDGCGEEINRNYNPPSSWLTLTLSIGFIPNGEYDFCSHSCFKKWLHSDDRPWNL